MFLMYRNKDRGQSGFIVSPNNLTEPPDKEASNKKRYMFGLWGMIVGILLTLLTGFWFFRSWMGYSRLMTAYKLAVIERERL